MGSENIFFIDTQLIVHFIILSHLKGRKKERLKERYKNSFDFIKEVISNKKENLKFLTCSLSQSEIYFGLLDEYRCEKLYDCCVPLSSWRNEKWRTNLTEDEIDEITNHILNFSYKYIYSKGDKPKKILSVIDIHDPEIIPELVFRHNVRTHDAIIVSTAISEKCKYIVTRDNNLKKCLKDYKRIKLISPEEAIKKMKPSKTKKPS